MIENKTRKIPGLLLVVVMICGLSQILAQDLMDMSLEEILGISVEEEESMVFYGYFNANVEKVFDEPGIGDNGSTVYGTGPMEWSVPNFHLYVTSKLSDNINAFINIAGSGEDNLELRNAYGNFRINDAFQIRVGKIYRKFGLYNEKLDQSPIFMGIEPPELFDLDHLVLPRTTTLMVHGAKAISKGEITYTLSSENSEGGANLSFPLGWDLRMKTSKAIFGTSGYMSSINDETAQSTVDFHSGSPRGGVLPWMDEDKYSVIGTFAEVQLGKFLVQSEFWNASHEATRNAANVLEIVTDAGINEAQRENFLGDNASKADDDLTEADVVVDSDYDVKTFYVRLGYSMQTDRGEFMPYVFYDWMDHPETIQNKKYGGDNESGLSDDGQFAKASIGIVYRPIPTVAIKLDASSHMQKFNGEDNSYPEVRLDMSWAIK